MLYFSRNEGKEGFGMKANLQALCDQFISNRDIIKSAFRWDSHYLFPVCANLFCARGETASEKLLAECRDLIKASTGVFSAFRGNIRMPVACMLARSSSPQAQLEQALKNYKALKGSFWSSDYLALAAFMITELGGDARIDQIVTRGRGLYDRMRKEHPFLTASEDSIFAVLLAFSDRSDDDLVQDMEETYRLLKERFRSGNCVQTMSHVLALTEGSAGDKAAHVISLYDAVTQAGGKYGRHYELATLAALAGMGQNDQEIAADMMDVDAFLAQQKGYGGLGIDKRTRLMHAAMIVSDQFTAREQVDQAAMTGTLSMIIAQQMAMCACIASTTTAAQAASNH